MSIKHNVDFPFQMAAFLGKPKSPLQSLDHVPPSNSSSHFHKKWPHLIKCTHLYQWVKILLLISEKVLFWVNETIAYDGHLHILKYDLPFAAQKYPCAGPGKFAKLWSISTWDLYKRRASSNASLHKKLNRSYLPWYPFRKGLDVCPWRLIDNDSKRNENLDESTTHWR